MQMLKQGGGNATPPSPQQSGGDLESSLMAPQSPQPQQSQGDPLTAALMNGPAPQQAPQSQQPQQGQQQPPDTPTDMSNPANNAQNAGPVKAGLRHVLAGILQNFSYGAGQSMIKASGGETDAEQAVRLATTAHINAQTQLAQQQANMLPYQPQGPNGPTVYLPQKMYSDIEKQRIANQGKQDVANTNKRYVSTPQGLYDTQTKDANGFPSLTPNSGSGITITPEMTDQYPIPKEFVGRQIKLTDLAALERGAAFQNQMVQTSSGPIMVNRSSAQATPITGPGGQRYSPPALANPREIADVDNPGQTKIVSGAQAMGQPGPNSASVQVPKRAEIAEVPTAIGNQKVAFSTAIAHADLLRQSMAALNNGDVQALNSLSNRFKNEFGVAGPVTAQAIADAYQREVTSVLSKGHMTDSEIASVGKTINPSRQNSAQVDSVLSAYQALAQSKMNQLDQQTQTAVQKSQPKKPGAGFDWSSAPKVKQ